MTHQQSTPQERRP